MDGISLFVACCLMFAAGTTLAAPPKPWVILDTSGDPGRQSPPQAWPESDRFTPRVYVGATGVGFLGSHLCDCLVAQGRRRAASPPVPQAAFVPQPHPIIPPFPFSPIP